MVLGFRLCLDNSTLPKITAVATSGLASARLSVVAPAGPSAASYTTTRGTTPDAAQAIADTMGTTLLLAWSGESLMLSAMPNWAQQMAVGLSLDQPAV